MLNKSHMRYIVLAMILILAASYAISQEEKMTERKFELVTKPVWTTPSKSQGRTGTCWCFATTSFIESEVQRLTGQKFELSEMYTVYNAWLEKATYYARLGGKNNFSQGGLSHDFLYLVPKYGMVPTSDYSGLLEGQTSHQHFTMEKEMRTILDEQVKSRKPINEDFLKPLKEVLNKNIGAIPATITHDGKTMTPQEFANNVLKFNPDNYVELTSFSHMPFYKKASLLVPDNWMRYGNYYNVPLDDFMAVVDNAFNTGFSVAIDIDVSEKTNQGRQGFSYMPQDLEGKKVTQAEREEMFNDRRTTDDHLVHSVAIAKDQDGIKYYFTKDSGGPSRGPYQGFYYISENYYRAKVLAIFVHKDAVPAELKTKLGIK